MRLLDSICKVIASSYVGKPVHIEEVPNNFKRDCFMVKLATDNTSLKSFNIYGNNSVFQIVYFGKRNEANEGLAENLYRVKEELKALFLLQRCVPVIPLEDVEEKPRYAKIETYSDEIRLDEGALYVKLTLNFTEDLPKTGTYEPIEEVDLVTETVTNR